MTRPGTRSRASGRWPERLTFSRNCSLSGVKMRMPRPPREMVTYHCWALVAALMVESETGREEEALAAVAFLLRIASLTVS